MVRHVYTLLDNNHSHPPYVCYRKKYLLRYTNENHYAYNIYVQCILKKYNINIFT